MKILTVSVSYYPSVSGVATVAGKISRAMVQKGHEVAVVCPSMTDKDLAERREGIVEYRLASFINPLRVNYRIPFPKVMRIAKIIKEFRPEIVHLHDPAHISLITLYFARKNKIPVLYTHHFIPGFITSYLIKEVDFMKNNKFNFIERVVNSYIKSFAQSCSHIVVPSTMLQEYLRNIKIISDISVITNGVDLRIFNKSRRKSRKENLVKLLYLGRLDKDKSLECLIKALPYVKSKFRLTIAGVGKQLTYLFKLAEKTDVKKYIKFIGYIEEYKKPEFFKNSDIFVIPSNVEVQSIVTLEAMAAGLPVVASNAAALPELVKESKGGLLFKSNNYLDLAEKINLLAGNTNLREKMSLASLKYIKNHNIVNTFSAYEQLYFKLLKVK